MPWDSLLLAVAVILAAAFVRGYAGFGFSSILMAGLIIRFPASQIVPLSIVLEILASLGQARGILADIDRRAVGLLLAAGLAGNPLGVFLLGYLPDQPMRIAVHLLILGAVLVLLLRPVRASVPTAATLVIAGFAAGVVNGATALSGLVLGLFFSTTTISSRAMRATMIAYFFFTDIWATMLLAFAGHYDRQILIYIAAALPLLATGIWLGGWLFARSTTGEFRQAILLLLLALCLLGLGGAVL